MSLAHKYRPKTFNEVAGNDATVKAILSKLDRPRDEFPHAILLTGPAGNGKTTLGRIIANELGCSDMDYHEMDAAAYRSIDDVRKLRNDMYFTPADGECSVWLLDEVHMLGQGGASEKNAAQNALLKALEEPPDHVYFILATTNPEMLLPTIRSRSACYEVKPLERDEMLGFLRSVVSRERKRVPPEVLEQIELYSLGSCRTALHTLDKIIDLPVDDMLSLVEQEARQQSQVIDLCRSIMAMKPWKVVAEIIKGLEKEDPEKTRLAIMTYCGNTLLSGKDVAAAFIVMDYFRDPFYVNGRNGLIHAAYLAVEASKPAK